MARIGPIRIRKGPLTIDLHQGELREGPHTEGHHTMTMEGQMELVELRLTREEAGRLTQEQRAQYLPILTLVERSELHPDDDVSEDFGEEHSL